MYCQILISFTQLLASLLGKNLPSGVAPLLPPNSDIWDEILKLTYIHLYMCSWYKNCCRHHFHSNHHHQSHRPFCCLHHHKMCPQSIVFLHHFLEEKRLSNKFLVGWNHSISKGTSRISSSKCGRADPRRLHTQHGSFNLQLHTV